jgi:hypothetical protein
MTNRDTFQASVKTAATTQASAVDAAFAAHHAAIDAVTSTIGYVPGTGNNATLQSTIATANKAKLDALAAAEMAKQAAQSKAKDTLRATGDIGPM